MDPNRATAHSPTSVRVSARRSLLLVAGWAAAAALCGPLLYAVGATGAGIAGGELAWRGDPTAVLGFAFGLAAYAALAGIALGLPQVLPFLLLWAVVARRWDRLETIGGVLAGTAAIATVSAAVSYFFSNGDPQPLAPHGAALLPGVAGWGGVVWLALVLPRLVVAPLRIGAFSAGR